MAKGAYIGIENTSKELKNAYVGINGIAKEIKEIYVGVEGVPKLVWQSIPPNPYIDAAYCDTVLASETAFNAEFTSIDKLYQALDTDNGSVFAQRLYAKSNVSTIAKWITALFTNNNWRLTKSNFPACCQEDWCGYWGYERPTSSISIQMASITRPFIFIGVMIPDMYTIDTGTADILIKDYGEDSANRSFDLSESSRENNWEMQAFDTSPYKSSSWDSGIVVYRARIYENGKRTAIEEYIEGTVFFIPNRH